MLDNEPDTDNPSTSEQPLADTPATPQPRRRRAASRPAGPPSSDPDAPPIEPVGEAPEAAAAAAEPTSAAEVPSVAAKRPARKRAAAKPATDGEEKPARTPRKRAAKKAVPAAEESVDEILAPAEVDLTQLPPTEPLPSIDDE